MIKFRELDNFPQEDQDYFFLLRPSLLVDNGAYEIFVQTLLNISFLAKKISRYGLKTVFNDLDISFPGQTPTIKSIKQILVQSQDRFKSSLGEQDVFGVLHSLLTHNPDFIEFVAREELSGDVDLPILTSLHPMVNLPTAGDFVPRQIIKMGTGYRRVHSAALSPDGKFLAFADLEIELWDLESGEKKYSIFPEGQVSCLDFSSDSERLLVSTRDKKDTIWDKGNFLSVWGFRDNLQLLMLEVHSDSVNKGFFGHDSSRIYSGSDDGKLLTIDAGSGRIIYQLEQKLPIKDCVYSKLGNTLYTISGNDIIQAWDGETNKNLFSLRAEHGDINKIAISSDEKFLLTVYEHGSLGIWDITEKRELMNLYIKNAKAMDGLVSVESGRILSIFSDHSIRIWDLASGELKASLIYAYSDPVKCFINSKGDCAITFGNRFLHFWDTGSLFEFQGIHHPDQESFAHHIFNQSGKTEISIIPRSIRSGHFLRNGRFVAVDSDSKIKIWDSKSGQISKVLDASENTWSCVPNHDGSLLISYGTSDAKDHRGKARIWNLSEYTSQEINLLAAKEKLLTSCAISPDGKYCVFGYTKGLLEMRDLETGQLRYQIYGHERDVEQVRLYGLPSHEDIRQCAIARGNSLFATIARYDDHILIWDLSLGELSHKLYNSKLDSYSFIAFTSDGNHLLAVGNSMTRLGEPQESFLQFWEVPNFTQSKQINLGKLNPQNYFSDCALESKNQFMAFTCFDGQVSIWDIVNGSRVAWTKLADSLDSCAWSDNQTLMIGGEKGAYFLWLVSEIPQWRRFGRGVFDTGYQPRLHFFGDGSLFENHYEKMNTRLKEDERDTIVESIVYKSELDVSAKLEMPALIYNNVAISLAYLKQFETAQEIFQKIRQEERSKLNEFEQCVIAFNGGCLQYFLGNYDGSREILKELLKRFEYLQRKSWQGKTLNQLGIIEERVLAYRVSIQYYLQALPLFEEARCWNEVAELKVKISNAYERLNEPDQSLFWMTAYFQDLHSQKNNRKLD